MVARVWFSRSILTFSLASTAWCRPSDQRRPGIRRPVNSSTMMTSPSFTTYSTSRLYKRVRLDGGIDVVLQVPVFRIGNVADAQKLLDFFPAFIGDGDAPVFLVHHVVAGEFFGLAGRGVDFLAFFQLGDDAIDPGILVGGLFAGAGNDQRGAGFVDQDGIDFVDDGEVVPALHAIA